MTPQHIPLNDPAVLRIKQLIPVEYHDRTWIAGSAAARWPEAQAAGGDVDAWILIDRWPAYWEMYKWFTDTYGPVPEKKEDEYASMPFDKLYASGGLHIIGASEVSIQKVVDDFDISCHAAAVPLLGGELYLHPQFSSDVRILRWSHPRVTLFRGCRFALRYDDQSFWTDPQTKACAARAFQHRDLLVAEGL